MENLKILHLDMDAFFAAIEQNERPYLKGRPVVVGGKPDSRGVVSTASYEAREYGIHSGMSCKEAYNLCPKTVFLPVRMERYKQVSRTIRSIFEKYASSIEPLSIDEAFLEIEENPVQEAKKIKEEIYKKTGLTVSVGVSYNKYLAKLASDLEKPDGFTVMTRQKAEKILPDLPIRKIWGVGSKTEKDLQELGMFKIKDIQRADVLLLKRVLGKRAEEVRQLSYGIDERQLETVQTAKSYGEERTLSKDEHRIDVLRTYVNDFAEELSERLVRSHLKARTVTLKMRYDDFDSISRSKTVEKAVDDKGSIAKIAVSLMNKTDLPNRRVRLIGVQVGNFLYPGDPEQMKFPF